MNATNDVLLGLLRRALFDCSFSFDAAKVDWAELMKEARAQTVHLLIYDCLTAEERTYMPYEIAAQWQNMALLCLSKNEQLAWEQNRILAELKEAGIPCVILKGSSSAFNYPNPGLRCAGDIDLLVSADNLKKAEVLLQGAGYISHEGEHPCHIAMYRGQYAVEVHFEPSGLPGGETGARLRQYLLGVETKAVEQQGLPIMPPCHEAVVLLVHKLNHIVGSGLGLRQLCDWAEFVYKKLGFEQWKELEPLLTCFGILHFAKVVTRLCVNYLGLPEQAAPWCTEADGTVVQELLEDLLRTGNFGHKENRYGQRLFTDGGAGGRVASLCRVGLRVCRNGWPICKDYPMLIILAPFVILVRYCKRRKDGKRPAFRPITMFREAGQRQMLYQELRPFWQDEEEAQ